MTISKHIWQPVWDSEWGWLQSTTSHPTWFLLRSPHKTPPWLVCQLFPVILSPPSPNSDPRLCVTHPRHSYTPSPSASTKLSYCKVINNQHFPFTFTDSASQLRLCPHKELPSSVGWDFMELAGHPAGIFFPRRGKLQALADDRPSVTALLLGKPPVQAAVPVLSVSGNIRGTLVHSGCCNKSISDSATTKTKILSRSSGGWEHQGQGTSRPGVRWGLSSWFAGSRLHAVSSHGGKQRERRSQLPPVSSDKETNPTGEDSTPTTQSPPRGPTS